MNKLGIGHILRTAGDMKPADAITYLRNNNSSTLADIIKVSLDPRVKWLLPEGDPPYVKNDMEHQEHILFREVRKLYMFLEGGGDHLRQMHREQLFVDMLQIVSPRDAEVLLAAKDKRLYGGVTRKTIIEAFPGLLPA